MYPHIHSEGFSENPDIPFLNELEVYKPFNMVTCANVRLAIYGYIFTRINLLSLKGQYRHDQNGMKSEG